MRIRQPIGATWRISLGILSILLLIGAYTWLSQHRQAARRRAAAEQLVDVQSRLAEVDRQLAESAPEDSDAAKLQSQHDRLLASAERLTDDAAQAVDRSVPTWSSLYRDGLLRVIMPQGLKHDEYWLWDDASATLVRLAAGLIVGVLLSIAVGMLMGCFTPWEALLVPPLSFLAKIPPTAMLAVFFILVGTTFKMYVTMIAFGVLPTLAQSIYQSAKKDVPDELIFKAYTLGADTSELVWNVIYKQILPRLLDAVRLQVGPAMVLLIAAEWMVAGEGFGYRLRLFYQRTDMTVVLVYLILLGAVGLVIDLALTWARRWICPWFGE